MSEKPIALALITGLFAIVLASLIVSTGPWWLSAEVSPDAGADAGPCAETDAGDDAGRVQVELVRVLIDPDFPVSGEIASAIHRAAVRGIHDARLTDVPPNFPIASNVATITVCVTNLGRDGSHIVATVRATVTRGHESEPVSVTTIPATGAPPSGTEPTSQMEAQVVYEALRSALSGLRRGLGQ